MERLGRKNTGRDTRGSYCLEHRKYLKRQFLLAAAPVLAGVKPSSLMSFPICCRDVWETYKKHIHNTTGLLAEELYRKKEKVFLLIYNETLMNEHLKSSAARELLCRYNYPSDGSLDRLLSHLKGRFCDDEFPHEIGIFFGYPTKDVKAFIEKGGRDYLCCRYWKVYHDEQGAKKTFSFIDKAKAHATSLIAQQTPVFEATKILANLQFT